MLTISLNYYKKNDFELENEEAFLRFAQKAQKHIAILTYGNGLDEHTVNNLIETYLDMKPSKEQGKLNIRYDTYDANVKSIHRNHWLSEIQMDEARFLEFEAAVQQIKGTHLRIHHRVRGHFNVEIDGKEYSTSVYKTRDCSKIHREHVEGRYLFFIDEESPDNQELREKVHLLPEKLQFLSLPVTIKYEDREIYVRDWIKRILQIAQDL